MTRSKIMRTVGGVDGTWSRIRLSVGEMEVSAGNQLFERVWAVSFMCWMLACAALETDAVRRASFTSEGRRRRKRWDARRGWWRKEKSVVSHPEATWEL